MSLDKERILKRLGDIERYSSVLGGIVPNSYEAYENSSSTTKAAVERYLQLISDLELEVLALAYKDLDLGIAGSEESLVGKFEKLMSKEAIEGFKERRALRNLLVRAYFEMHYEKEAFEQASKREDVAKFIKEITNIINKQT
jgi:uncharacterized protein YutE (UPF0331/DUF86 family)